MLRGKFILINFCIKKGKNISDKQPRTATPGTRKIRANQAQKLVEGKK
jgi:hypothetical protein